MTDAVVVSSASATSFGREVEHLAQDQHRALVGRQVLQRGDERQLDALAQLVARLGAGEPVVEPGSSGYGSTHTDSITGWPGLSSAPNDGP